jgi:hypothetical protein
VRVLKNDGRLIENDGILAEYPLIRPNIQDLIPGTVSNSQYDRIADKLKEIGQKQGKNGLYFTAQPEGLFESYLGTPISFNLDLARIAKVQVQKHQSVRHHVLTQFQYELHPTNPTMMSSSKAAVIAIREQRSQLTATNTKPRKTTNPMQDRTTWNDPPPFILTSEGDDERIAIRNANHEVYKAIGNTAIWNKYIKLGYYIYDDCMQFHKVWKSTAKDSITERHKVVWQSYHFHRMHEIEMNNTLKESATKTTRSYLKEKDPDYLLATDIEFEEKEFFKATKPLLPNDDTSSEEETEWTEVRSNKKPKKKSPPQSPLTIPENNTHMKFTDDMQVKLSQAKNTPIPVSVESPNRKAAKEKITNVRYTNLSNTDINPTPFNTEEPNTTNPYKRTSDAISPDAITPDNDNKRNNKANNSNYGKQTQYRQTLHNNEAKTTEYDTTNNEEGHTDDHTISTQTTHNTHETQSPTDRNRNYSAQSTHHSTQSTNDHHRNFISVNDGTLRITIR